MNTLNRSRLLDQTLKELRKLKEQGPPTSYRAALQLQPLACLRSCLSTRPL